MRTEGLTKLVADLGTIKPEASGLTLVGWECSEWIGVPPPASQLRWSHDVVLPTATHGQIRLRCITQPDAAQAALLDRLDIVLPKRMRLAAPEWQTLAATA